MANQSAVEQALLEMLNRARLDPAAEAARFGISLNEGVAAADIITAASKQPLAMNDMLLSAARGHSLSMLDHDYFAHDDPFTGSTPPARMDAAGYSLSGWGENIAWRGTTGAVTQALELMLHQDLFVDEGVSGRGHRVNMMDPDFQEVGMGEVVGQFTQNGTTYNAAMLTQDFARPSGAVTQFLTGVAFNDNVVADQFYTIGEGRGNISVGITDGLSTMTGSAGGYSEKIDAGVKTVTFSGGGLATSVVLKATVAAGTNAKIDLMDQSTIRTSVSVAEVSGISKIIGLGTIGLSLTGGSGAETILGAKGNDVITGGAGNDYLDGGIGADVMSGNVGDDIYVIDSTSDTVNELAGEGNDQVYSSINFVLAAGKEIETLNTMGSSTTAAINLTGNEFANKLVGNAGANRLDGGGGADTTYGFGGNDIFIVDNTGDKVIEAVGAGADEVYSSVSYSLAPGQSIETLSTMGTSTTAAINLTGNEFANKLVGNASANRLDGGGGADTMYGFKGNDTFIVNNTGDKVFEVAGEGTDEVYSSVSYSLAPGQSIETLSTMGTSTTAAISLVGNELANKIVGNAGANTLNGAAGNDTLYGFGGSDTFRFNTALNASTNVDHIMDYNVADDTIQLENGIFTALTTTGTLNPNAFFIGSAAHDTDDHIIYNANTGALIYDSNGNAAGGAVQFATLNPHLALTNADFIVI